MCSNAELHRALEETKQTLAEAVREFRETKIAVARLETAITTWQDTVCMANAKAIASLQKDQQQIHKNVSDAILASKEAGIKAAMTVAVVLILAESLIAGAFVLWRG